MRVIGLTGGIGSGKSTVAHFLAEAGAVVIDADKIGHEVLVSDAEACRELVAVFGSGVLTPGGKISRRKLSSLVFGNPALLSELNRITHPRIIEKINVCLDEYRRAGVGMVVLEAALLLEAGLAAMVDYIWVAVASEKTVLRRLKERPGLSQSEALARIHSQLPVAERLKCADAVINTDCNLGELKEKVARLWNVFSAKV